MGTYAFANETDPSNPLNTTNFKGDIPQITVAELKKNIEENRNKVIIVNFWATWCPPCKEEIPSFINLYKEYKERGVEILGIALDVEGSKVVKPFAKHMGINYPLFIGGDDVHQEFKIDGIPTTLIYNKEGKLKIRHVGFATKEEFEAEILELLK